MGTYSQTETTERRNSQQLAIALAERGFDVAPLRYGKYQYARTHKRYAKLVKTSDPAEAAKLWTGRYAEDGVGFWVTSGLVLCDIESHGIELARTLGLLDLVTHTERTQNKGYHLIFSIDDAYADTLKRLAPWGRGIELFFAGHGNAIKVYNAEAHDGNYAPAPKVITDAVAAKKQADDAIRASRAKALSNSQTLDPADVSPETKSRYTERAISGTLDQIGALLNGNYHKELLRLCYNLGGYCATLGVDLAEVESRIREVLEGKGKWLAHGRTVNEALAEGTTKPIAIAWHAESHRNTLEAHHSRLLALIAGLPDTGSAATIVEGKSQVNVTWRTVKSVLLALQAIAQRYGQGRAFSAALGDVQTTGSIASRKSVVRGVHGALALGLIRKVKTGKKPKEGKAEAYEYEFCKDALAAKSSLKGTTYVSEREASAYGDCADAPHSFLSVNICSPFKGTFLQRLDSVGIKGRKLSVLQAIANGATSNSEIAEATGIARNKVSEVARSLQGLGFVVGYGLGDVEQALKELEMLSEGRRSDIAKRVQHGRNEFYARRADRAASEGDTQNAES